MNVTHHRSLPGEPAPPLVAGDLILVADHKPTLVHELIQARERQECGNTAWADLTHAACVVDVSGVIAEELGEGCVLTYITKYEDKDYWVVHFEGITIAQRALATKRWRRQVGTPYDYACFVGEFFQVWGFKQFIATSNAFICSGLWAFGSLAWEVSYPRAFETVTPGFLARYFNVPLGVDPKPFSFVGRVLNRVAVLGRILTWPIRKRLG